MSQDKMREALIALYQWYDNDGAAGTISEVFEANREALSAPQAASDDVADIQGHGEACYYCGEPCDSLAGDPGQWPVALPHRDNPGVARWHHAACVMDRLVENQENAPPCSATST